jgi:phospholipase A1
MHRLLHYTAAALLAATLAAAQVPASAQAAVAALAECAAIAADSERLACFDRISGRVAPAAAAPGAPPVTPAAVAGASMFDKAWAFDASSPRYDISLYAPTYFLFGRYTTDLNTAPYQPLISSGVLSPGTALDSTEAAFQLSFKFRMWTTDDRRWGAWAAYTQQSQWQVYNSSGSASRPFRETNYMPELILSYRPDLQWGDARWNLFNLAFNHQSNGRSDLLSRSWNRLIASFGIEQGDFAVLGRLWWRIPESSDTDDNPTLGDYYGWGDLSALYKWRDNSFSATIRGNPSTGKGAAQLAFTSSPLIGPLRGYVKLFSGYGESLIDYNHKATYVGLGISLLKWF